MHAFYKLFLSDKRQLKLNGFEVRLEVGVAGERPNKANALQVIEKPNLHIKIVQPVEIYFAPALYAVVQVVALVQHKLCLQVRRKLIKFFSTNHPSSYSFATQYSKKGCARQPCRFNDKFLILV